MPAPHLGCCGRHQPPPSRTHPGAPDSAPRALPPAHPPAEQRSKGREGCITNQSPLVPVSTVTAPIGMNKQCRIGSLQCSLWGTLWQGSGNTVIPIGWANQSWRTQRKIQRLQSWWNTRFSCSFSHSTSPNLCLTWRTVHEAFMRKSILLDRRSCGVAEGATYNLLTSEFRAQLQRSNFTC